jgi:hypothetical protein
MKSLPILACAAALLILPAACSGGNDAADDKHSVSISIGDKDGEGGDAATATTATASASTDTSSVTIDADSDTGRVELSLPGGIEAKVKVPGNISVGSKFDIDGVGLYPGAKVGSVNVKAFDGKAGKDAIVKIGFAAPADAAVVADWYQQQFEAKKVAVNRSGETLTGKTEDGDDFTLALTQGPAGASQGLLTIVDAKG